MPELPERVSLSRGEQALVTTAESAVKRLREALEEPEDTMYVSISPKVVAALADWSKPVELRLTRGPISGMVYGLEVRDA